MSSIQVNGEEPTRIMAGAEPVERLAIGGKDVWANWNPAFDDNLVCWLDASDSSTISVSDNTQSLEIPISNIEFSSQDNDWGMAIFTTGQSHGLSENQPIELNIGEPWTNTTYAAGVIDDTSLYIYKDNSQIDGTTQLTIERFYVDDYAYDDPLGADGEGYFYTGYGSGWRYQLRFMFTQDVSAYDGTQITFTGGKWVNMFNGFSGSTQLNLGQLNGQTLTFVVSPHNNKMVRLMDPTKHQWEFTNATSGDGGYLITKPGVNPANNAPHPIADWINPGSNTAWTDPNSSGTVYKQTTDGKDIDVGWQAPYLFIGVQDGGVEITALYNSMMLPLSGDDEPVAWYTAKYINNPSAGYPYYAFGMKENINGIKMNPVSTYNPDTPAGDGAGTFVDPDGSGGPAPGENLDVNGQIYRWDDASMTRIRNNLATNSNPAGQLPSSRRPNTVVYPQTFPGLSINDIGLDTASGTITTFVSPTVVDSIQDKSGNNNTFSANSIDKPSISTVKTNGRDTITFNTQTIRGATGIYGEQTLKNETLNLQMPSTIHMVYKTSSTNNYDHPLELFSGITNETSKERWRLTTYEQPTDILYPGVNLNNHPDQEPQFPKGGRVQLHVEGKHPASHVFRIEPRTEGGTQVKFYRCIKTHTCPLVDQEPEKAPGYPSSEYWQEVTKPTGNMWSGDSELFPGVSKVTRINETHVELWSAHTGDARIGGMQRGMLINMEPPGGDDPTNAWNQRYMSPTWPLNDEATLQETWQEKIIHLAPVSTGDSGNNYRYTVKNSELSYAYGQYAYGTGDIMPSLNNLDWSPEDCWFIPWDIRRTQTTGASRIHGPLVQNWDDIITDNGSFHGNGRHSTVYLTRSSFIFHQEQTEDSYVMFEGSKYRCIRSNIGNSPSDTNYWQSVENTGETTPEWSVTEYYYSMTPVDIMSLSDDQWRPTTAALAALPTTTPALPCRTFDDPGQVNVLTIRWENQMTAPRVYLNGEYLGQSGARDMQNSDRGYYYRPDITALQLAANNPNGVVLGADSNNNSINNGIWSLCELIISSNIDISTLLKTHGYLCNKWRADVDSEFKYYNRLPSTFDDVSDKWSPLKTSSTPGINFTTPVTKVVDIDASTETSITTGYGGYPVVDIASRVSEYPWEFNTTGDIFYSTGDQLHFTGTGDSTYDGNTFYINKLSDTKLTISSSNSEPTVVTVPVTMFSGLTSKNIDQPMMAPDLQVSNYNASYIPIEAKDGYHALNHSLFWPHRLDMSYVTHPMYVDQPWGPFDKSRLNQYEFNIDWNSYDLTTYWYEQYDQLALYRRLTYGSLVIDLADLPQVSENAYVIVEDMTGFLTTFQHYDTNAPGISVGDVLYLKKSRAGLTTSTQMEELTAYTVHDGGQFSIYDTLSLDNPFLPAVTADYFQLSPCYKYTSSFAQQYNTPDGVGSFKEVDAEATYEATAKLDNPMYRVSYRGNPDDYDITTNSTEWWSDHTGTITLKIFNEDHPSDARLNINYSSGQLGGLGGVERLDSSTDVSVSFSQSDTSKKPLKDTSTGRSAIKFDINSAGEMDTLTNTGNIFDISSGTELNEYTICLMATVKLPSNGQVDIIRQNDNNFKVTVDNQGFIRVFQHGSAMIVNQFVKTGDPFMLVMYQKNNIKYARLNGIQQAYEFSANGLTVTDQWHIAGGVASDQEISISNLYAYTGDVFESDIEKLEGELTRANRQRKLLPKNHPYRYRSV